MFKFVPFDSKTSKPIGVGFRLAKAIYKTPRDGSEKKQSICVSIPVVTDLTSEQLKSCEGILIERIKEIQDSIVKERYENGSDYVSESQISIESCLEFWNAESQGNRLTKEIIIEWFSNDLNDSLLLALADKLGISNSPSEVETSRLEKMLKAYSDSFAALAGGKTSFPPEKAKNLLKAIDFASDSAIKEKLIARLEKMKEEISADLFAL